MFFYKNLDSNSNRLENTFTLLHYLHTYRDIGCQIVPTSQSDREIEYECMHSQKRRTLGVGQLRFAHRHALLSLLLRVPAFYTSAQHLTCI
jgi:hypothetical protein